MRGDAVSEHVVRRAPAALAPGAFASVLIAWALDPDDPMARPRSWLEGSGCDAFLLHTSTDDPIETAAVWNRELADRPEAYADAHRPLARLLPRARDRAASATRAWCSASAADGRDGWLETQQLPRAGLRPAGRHVRKLFETHDRLAEIESDDALLDRRLRVVDDAVVSQETRFADGRWHAESLTLRLESRLALLGRARSRARRVWSASSTARRPCATRSRRPSMAKPRRKLASPLARQMLAVGFLDFVDVSSQA